MPVHPTALDGFASDPERYERSRPGYPQTAIDWLAERIPIGPGRTVVDLAAGTGKLTRLLVARGSRVVAVEPVAGMRQVLAREVPGASIVAGVAEALPFGDASVDALTVAQAFHWFDPSEAFREFARVIRVGGGAGLIWNTRDRSIPWLDEVWAITDRVEQAAPWRSTGDGPPRRGPERPPGFTPVERATFRHTVDSTVAELVERVASVSHVAILPPHELAGVLEEVREVIRGHRVAEADTGHLEVPYRVDVFGWRRTE